MVFAMKTPRELLDHLSRLSVEEVEEELATLLTQRRDLDGRIAIVETFLRLVRGDQPSPQRGTRKRPDVAAATAALDRRPLPSVKDRILYAIQQEPPGTPWRAGHVIAAVKASQQGQHTTQAAILAALTRLVDDGRLRRPRKGWYELPATPEPDQGTPG